MSILSWLISAQGRLFPYYSWFAIAGSTIFLLLSFLSFVLYFVFSKIQSHASTHTQNIAKWLKNASFKLGFYFLSAIPLICSALHVIYFAAGVVGMAAILTLMVFLINGRMNWAKEHAPFLRIAQEDNIVSYERASAAQSFVKACLKIDKKTKRTWVKMLVISVALNCLMYKTCLCFYNIEVGYYNDVLGFGINTYLTRLFQLKYACPPGPPCHLYATIPQDPSSAFFLNLHTHKDINDVTVYYKQFDTSEEYTGVKAQSYTYSGLEWKAERAVHSALITGLKPDTRYQTKVYYGGTFYTNAIYKTLPDSNTRPIRMINAGDSGYTDAAVNLSKMVAQMHPDIFFMGGDIAYDDNMPACAYTWDSFLNMYEGITTTLGYLMPLVLSVGNHDVGLNELTGIQINKQQTAYFLYFPQHYDHNADGHTVKRVPPILHRRSYQNYTFANVHYVCLDSGYIVPFHKEQKTFLAESLANNPTKLKFVNYHVPIYSACESLNKDPTRYLYALFHWVPNFDNYKVMTAFQNHVHSFKRTKPLRGNAPSDKGTVYVGDGAYGAIVSEMCKPDATIQIFQTITSLSNMWVSDIYSDHVYHAAYTANGTKIDEFVQYANDYHL